VRNDEHAPDEARKFRGHRGELWLVNEVTVADAVDRASAWRDRTIRLDSLNPMVDVPTVRIETDHGDLNNAILL